MRQIFFDIETTGFKHADGHRVVEVAAIEYVNQKPTGNEVHLYFNPERIVPPEVVKVHGLDNAFLDDKPKFKETIGQLQEFVSGADEVLIHNGAGFDLPFMDAELRANGFTPMTDWPVGKFTDTLKVARAMSGSKQNSLDALCDKYKVDRSKRTSHGAVIDCELLAEVWQRMTASVNFDAPDTSNRQEPIQRLTARPELRVVFASEGEKAAEAAYLADWAKNEPKVTLPFQAVGDRPRMKM
jgi:DNA polymerase-3 subunit epsilon